MTIILLTVQKNKRRGAGGRRGAEVLWHLSEWLIKNGEL